MRESTTKMARVKAGGRETGIKHSVATNFPWVMKDRRQWAAMIIGEQ